MKKTVFSVVMLAAVLLLSASAAMAKTNSKKRTTTKANSNTEQVIFTGEIAKRVIGYNGTTPLNVTVKGGKIVSIEALPNDEDPQYFRRAARKVFSQYEGLSVADALKLSPDAATGATYSSEALIQNIQLALKQLK